MPRGNNNRNPQQNSEDRITKPPSGKQPPPARLPRVSDHGGQDSVGPTCQIDTDHDMAQRLQEAENQLAIEREERSKDQKKIKELSYMATVVNTISRHGNPTEVPNDKINDARKGQIKEFIDTYVWRYTQFFPDLPGEQHILLAFILQGMGIKNKADMIKFSGKYSGYMASVLNDNRGYSSNRVRAKMEAYWGSNGKTLPPLEKMFAIAYRTLDLTDEDNLWLAGFYWDHLLDKLTPANIKHWSPDIRHYQLISEAGWEDKKVTKKKEFYITPQMEAFLMALLENQYEVWTAQFSLKKGDLSDKRIRCCPTLLKKDASQEQIDQGYIVEGDYINVWGPKWVAKYSDSQSGNSRLKGWNQKGKERYAEILKQVEQARKDVEKCKAFETTIWKKLRDKHGVTGSNPQENKRNKRRKMAIEDEAPKIELLPPAFTSMVSPEMMASVGFTLEGYLEYAEEDEEQEITEI
jgi:hypothetical protein